MSMDYMIRKLLWKINVWMRLTGDEMAFVSLPSLPVLVRLPVSVRAWRKQVAPKAL